MTESTTTGQPRHREALLREGLNQLFAHGYHGTTVDRLLEASGVPKGSFYHHFHSKEEFAAAVLERYGGFHYERLARWAAKPDLSTPDKLSGYFRELSQIFVDSGYLNTDLAGKFATEVTTTSDPLRAQVASIVTTWRVQLEQILAAGQANGDVRSDRDVSELSAAIHALMDGAFVVAASTRNRQSLESVAMAIRSLTIVV